MALLSKWSRANEFISETDSPKPFRIKLGHTQREREKSAGGRKGEKTQMKREKQMWSRREKEWNVYWLASLVPLPLLLSLCKHTEADISRDVTYLVKLHQTTWRRGWGGWGGGVQRKVHQRRFFRGTKNWGHAQYGVENRLFKPTTEWIVSLWRHFRGAVELGHSRVNSTLSELCYSQYKYNKVTKRFMWCNLQHSIVGKAWGTNESEGPFILTAYSKIHRAGAPESYQSAGLGWSL